MHRHRKKVVVILGFVFLLLLAVFCISIMGSNSVIGAVVKGPAASVPILIAQFLPAIIFLMFLIIGLVKLGTE